MAHHSSVPDDIRQELEQTSKRLGLGATGAYPEGVVNDLDEGEIQFGIAADPQRQKVFLNFGKDVSMVGMTFDQAIAMSESLRDNAFKVKGVTV